jgi:hypothetical protein
VLAQARSIHAGNAAAVIVPIGRARPMMMIMSMMIMSMTAVVMMIVMVVIVMIVDIAIHGRSGYVSPGDA